MKRAIKLHQRSIEHLGTHFKEDDERDSEWERLQWHRKCFLEAPLAKNPSLIWTVRPTDCETNKETISWKRKREKIRCRQNNDKDVCTTREDETSVYFADVNVWDKRCFRMKKDEEGESLTPLTLLFDSLCLTLTSCCESIRHTFAQRSRSEYTFEVLLFLTLPSSQVYQTLVLLKHLTVKQEKCVLNVQDVRWRDYDSRITQRRTSAVKQNIRNWDDLCFGQCNSTSLS